MKNFCNVVGLSYEGYEEQMLALFIAIEANWKENNMPSSSVASAKTNTKGRRELQRLTCSINYDGKRGATNEDNGKGRGFCLSVILVYRD